jgi:general stress protein 26
MPAPKPEAIDPATLPDRALAVMRRAKFPVLATMDGDQPRARPVSPVRTEGFTVYIANLRRYGKTTEIAVNPKVELCYCDDQHCQVRITGVAETVTDEALIADIWASNPLLGMYLGTAQNPEFILYRVRPERVRFMQEWALEYYEISI